MRTHPLLLTSKWSNDPRMIEWLKGPFTKICVYVESEEELLGIERAAVEAGVIYRLITDAGRTEFKGVPTHTVLAVGPDTKDVLEPITGHLKLL